MAKWRGGVCDVGGFELIAFNNRWESHCLRIGNSWGGPARDIESAKRAAALWLKDYFTRLAQEAGELADG